MGSAARMSGGPDPVREFQHESRWSSFTTSWSRRFRGWHWPLRGNQFIAVLLVGAAFGASMWAVSALLRWF